MIDMRVKVKNLVKGIQAMIIGIVIITLAWFFSWLFGGNSQSW